VADIIEQGVLTADLLDTRATEHDDFGLWIREWSFCSGNGRVTRECGATQVAKWLYSVQVLGPKFV
jgi:hypothetical protein